VRIVVIACLIAAASLSTWSAYLMHSLLIGQADGEIALLALAASALATIVAAIGLSFSTRRRHEWPTAYFVGSISVASFSVIVGIWAWLTA
jgi:hypothetical protein